MNFEEQHIESSFSSVATPEDLRADTPSTNKSPSTQLSAMAALAGIPTGDFMSRGKYQIDLEKDLTQKEKDAVKKHFDGDLSQLSKKVAAETRRPMVPGRQTSDQYLKAPPGDATRVFMATAGIYDREKKNRRAATGIAIGLLLFASLIGLDIAGIWTIPGIGIVYETTGIADPNVERARSRYTEKLQNSTLSAEERQKIADRLMGLGQPIAQPKRVKKSKPQITNDTSTEITEKHSLQDKAEKYDLKDKDKKLAYEIFNDRRKSRKKPKLAKVEEIQTPNLPRGLTSEAILQVISDNSSSMSLCLNESFKRGEKLKGRMEIEMTIQANGQVQGVKILSSRFRNSLMAECTVRRIKSWRFPRFKGGPVPVSFPYVLSAGF